MLALGLLWLRARLRLLWRNGAGLRSVFTAPRRYRLEWIWFILRLALLRASRSLGRRLRDGRCLAGLRPVLWRRLLGRRLEGPLLIRLRPLLLRILRRLRLRGDSLPSRFHARRRRHRTRGQYCRVPGHLVGARSGGMILGLQRLRRDDLRRPPTVYTCELGPICLELPRVLNLRLHWREPLLTQHGHFLRHWPHRHAAGAAVIAHAIRGDVCGPVIIDIADHRGIHVRDIAVVGEITVSPIASVKSAARVAVTIVNSAIEPDVRRPIASAPQIAA